MGKKQLVLKTVNSPRRFALGIAAAIVIALVPSFVGAQATTTSYRATLNGTSEVPANTSTATGTFTATLDEAAGTLTWTLTVPTITAMTMSHLHTGAAGANGGVVLDLFIPPTGTTAGTVNASGTARAADLKGPMAGNLPGFIAALKAGTIYANVHTTANPGGEIRGQVASTTATTPPAAAPAPAPAKTGSAGLSGISSMSLMVALGLVAATGAVVFVSRRATR